MAKAIREGGRGPPRRSVLRQGRARGRRQGQGGLRDPRARAVRPARVLHLPGRAPLLPRRCAGPAPGGARQVGRRALRRAPERADRGRSRERRAAVSDRRKRPGGCRPLPASRRSRSRAEPDGLHARLPHHPRVASASAFPAMMLVANYIGLRRDDADALRLAQRWSKVAAVTFVVGAVTGTVLSFEMGLLWPEFMRRFGDVFGPCLRPRGDLLLHRGDLHRDLHLRLEAPLRLGALLDGHPGRDRRAGRGVVRGGRELVDEPAGRVQDRVGRERDGRRARSTRSSTERWATRRRT